jgi:hypothetical protein
VRPATRTVWRQVVVRRTVERWLTPRPTSAEPTTTPAAVTADGATDGIAGSDQSDGGNDLSTDPPTGSTSDQPTDGTTDQATDQATDDHGHKGSGGGHHGAGGDG